MCLGVEQHLRRAAPGGLQVTNCRARGSGMNGPVFPEGWRAERRSFGCPWTQVGCLSRNDPVVFYPFWSRRASALCHRGLRLGLHLCKLCVSVQGLSPRAPQCAESMLCPRHA